MRELLVIQYVLQIFCIVVARLALAAVSSPMFHLRQGVLLLISETIVKGVKKEDEPPREELTNSVRQLVNFVQAVEVEYTPGAEATEPHKSDPATALLQSATQNFGLAEWIRQQHAENNEAVRILVELRLLLSKIGEDQACTASCPRSSPLPAFWRLLHLQSEGSLDTELQEGANRDLRMILKICFQNEHFDLATAAYHFIQTKGAKIEPATWCLYNEGMPAVKKKQRSTPLKLDAAPFVPRGLLAS